MRRVMSHDESHETEATAIMIVDSVERHTLALVYHAGRVAERG